MISEACELNWNQEDKIELSRWPRSRWKRKAKLQCQSVQMWQSDLGAQRVPLLNSASASSSLNLLSWIVRLHRFTRRISEKRVCFCTDAEKNGYKCSCSISGWGQNFTRRQRDDKRQTQDKTQMYTNMEEKTLKCSVWMRRKQEKQEKWFFVSCQWDYLLYWWEIWRQKMGGASRGQSDLLQTCDFTDSLNRIEKDRIEKNKIK